ncbi:MAG: YidC/Oxa1 family membrane protein insertase [bacterium]
MAYLFHTFFYNPILNLLVYIYNHVPGADIGIAIVVLTVIIKLVLYPLSKRALVSQKAMQNIQPKLEELKEKFKDNKEALSKAMMELYKKEKVNPFSSCLPLLIQLPFFWAVFRVFRDELGGKPLEGLYSFVSNPGVLDAMAFGIVDFSKSNLPLAILAGVAQFLQAKLMPKPKTSAKKGSKEASMANIMGKQMMYFMPVVTVFICMSLPSGLAFYWFLTTVLTIFQQLYLFKKVHGDDDEKKVIEGEVVK